ncbi:MAG TPA: hypothetical protein VD927_11275 [Chryseosolibacter sp.]|nr:hypothetical protein [Chryseosolibacter sp.]
MNYIKYKEQELPCTIDFAVIKNVCAKGKLKLSDFESVLNDPTQIEVLFIEALKRGFKLEGKVFDISAEQAEDILAGSFADFLKIVSEDVLNVFLSSEAKKKMLEAKAAQT